MNVKIDTKETFSVIRIHEAHFAANMAEEMEKLLFKLHKSSQPHVIVNFEDVKTMDSAVAKFLFQAYTETLEQGFSFVLCCMQPDVIQTLEDADALDLLNITPTESEAWDIVHMEAIERELLNGENNVS
jgi:anti-anti-sigma factor